MDAYLSRIPRVSLAVVAYAWALIALAIAVVTAGSVDRETHAFVWTASIVVLPFAAAGAGWALLENRRALAVLLLLAAAATPTYYGYVLNIVPLLIAVTVVYSRDE